MILSQIFFSCRTDSSNNPAARNLISDVIVGKDNRAFTSDDSSLEQSLANRTGLIVLNILNKRGVLATQTCSATLIGKNHIMTAAHCLYDDEQGAFSSDTYFFPGQLDSGIAPFGRFQIIRSYMPSESIQFYDFRNDMAVAQLAPNERGQSAGDVAGYYNVLGDEEFVDGPVTTVGYPGDKGLFTQAFEKDCTAFVSSNNSRVLDLDCDVYPGQSGSALFISSESKNSHKIIGVISGQSTVSSVNYGSRVTKERQKIITSILDGEFNKSNFKEEWITKELKNQKNAVFARNNCENKIFVLNMAPLNSQKENENSHSIFLMPRNIRLLSEVKGNAISFAGHFLGEEENTTFKQINISDIKDQTLEFDCDLFEE